MLYEVITIKFEFCFLGVEMLYKMELTKYLKKCSATFFLILAADSCIALATDEKMENILLYTAMILFLIPIADLLFNHRLTESKKTNGMLSIV